MTRAEAATLAAMEFAHVLRFPALVLTAWVVGYAILGPIGSW